MSSHIPVQALIFDLRIGRCSFQRVSKYKNHRLTLGDWKYSLVTSLAPIRMWPSQLGLDASEMAEVFVQVHVSLQPDAAVCDSLGIDCCMDRQALLRLQHRDSSWELGWMYRYGSPGLQIGNQGVTVAMFLKALLSQRSLPAMVCEAPLMEDIALITYA
ncbi:hypothetical protein HBH56_149510 [Parastagonospora nodorum]|nr:hypothetical protein HBH56_149510 [Parastagonospora nodorum]KAH3928566.1 hypothetical protein HBH54_135410 [Parastagonospora nodorum]KAH3945997.1 hypothetical protein HBH53_136960 [Parastagonospora nodorum]KAH4003383.1 hypothetical protein HBI10_061000 [Parastagonospora nodorum]KAH4106696.1 hypothetical protein HBH46_069860 [Parastagonospora nodorum]